MSTRWSYLTVQIETNPIGEPKGDPRRSESARAAALGTERRGLPAAGAGGADSQEGGARCAR